MHYLISCFAPLITLDRFFVQIQVVAATLKNFPKFSLFDMQLHKISFLKLHKFNTFLTFMAESANFKEGATYSMNNLSIV